MARILKQGISTAAAEAAELKVRQTVEGILADIGKRGDAAVRDLSQQYDKWSPPAFRLFIRMTDDTVLSGFAAAFVARHPLRVESVGQRIPSSELRADC